MRMARRVSIDSKQQTWPASQPMPGACMTCTEIFGNGALITGTTTTRVLQRMGVPGWMRKQMKMHQGWCAGALGASVPGTAVRPPAGRTTRTIATIIAVFAFVALWRKKLQTNHYKNPQCYNDRQLTIIINELASIQR